MPIEKSAMTVGGLTMVSRVLGFVRDVLMAAVLGAGPVADAFVVAFRFPNLFRRLFGEGAFNAAFVPLFAKRMDGQGERAARAFAEQVFAVLFAVVFIVVIAAQIAMPALMVVFAPGFLSDPEKFDLSVLLTRIAFPYLLFMSMAALLGGVLNSLSRFAAVAAAPVLLNIVMISVLSALLTAGWGSTPATGQALVWGVSFAGVLQFAVLYAVAARAGLTLRLRRPRLTSGVRRMVRLGIPGVIAGGVTQLNLVISTMIASLQASAPAWLYYADRIYQLPLGVVGVAIGVVLLPDLSRRLRAGDDHGVTSSQNRAIEFSMLLTVPAAAALMIIPFPIIQVLFQHGAFSIEDARATALALAAFAAGLPAFVLIKVFSPGYFAREDTRTPMVFASISVAINIAGALTLFTIIGHTGIAIATTSAGWVNALLLARGLSKRGHLALGAGLKRNLVRITGASAVMMAALFGAHWFLGGYFSAETALTWRVALLLLLVAGGAIVYFVVLFQSGAIKRDDLRALLKR